MATPKLKLGNDKWATKQKSLLAFNDEGNNFKSLPFQAERLSGGSYVGRNGLIQNAASDEPRIDFTNYSKGLLLLELQRTNQITKSRDIQGWQDLGGSETVTNNNTTAPDGTNTAATIEKTGSDNTTLRFYTTLTNYSTVRSASIYIKKLSGNPTVSFGITDTQDSITPTNEWVRYTKDNVTPSNFGVPIFVDIEVSGVSGDKIAVWGAQLEEGASSTSLISTSGSSVTRIADICKEAGNSNVFNNSEGVLFAEIQALANDLTFRQICLTDSSTNTILMGYRNNSNRIYAQLIKDNVSQAFLFFDVSDITEFHKVALKYSSNSVHLWIDGVKRASDTNAAMPTVLKSLHLKGPGNSAFFYGKVKDLRVYNTALTDTELATLTT